MSYPDFLPRETHRLLLRRFSEADVQPFLDYRNDPVVARYQSWESCSAVEATEFIRHHHSQQAGVPEHWLQIAIALKNTDALLGDCAFKVHGHDPRQATIGVTLARQNQKQGFATESLSCLLDVLFDRMKLRRVIADVDVENPASGKLLERLGLKREGHSRQSLWFKGRWADEYHYSIPREVWLRGSQRATSDDAPLD